MNEIAAGIKSVLIQVHRHRAGKDEDAPDPIPILPSSSLSLLSFNGVAVDPDPPETNAWYILSYDGSTEPKIKEIFGSLPQDKPIHSRKGTDCVLVGSHLYDICCHGTGHVLFNTIRRLDIEKPGEGWKSQEIPLYCALQTTVVSGHNIYMFPHGGAAAFNTKQLGLFQPAQRGYVYNTMKQEGRVLPLPDIDICVADLSPLCIPVEDGVLLPIRVGEFQRWFKHNTIQWEWEKFGMVHPSLSRVGRHAYVVSNSKGVLFLYNYGILFTYRLKDMSLLGEIHLPEVMFGLDFKYDTDIHMVLLDHSTLCILWHRGPFPREEESGLHYAMVFVSDPISDVTFIDEGVLKIDAKRVINCLCLPCDFVSIRESGEEKGSGDLHMEDAPSKQRSASASSSSTQKKQKPEDDEVENCLKAVIAAEQRFNHAVTALSDVMVKHRQVHKKLKMLDA